MEKLNEPCQRTFSVMRRGDWIATDGLCDLIWLNAIVRYNTDDNLRRQIRIKLLREPRRILNIDLRSALHITVHDFV